MKRSLFGKRIDAVERHTVQNRLILIIGIVRFIQRIEKCKRSDVTGRRTKIWRSGVDILN